MKKKTLSLALALVLILLLTACGGSSNKTPSAAPDRAAPESTAPEAAEDMVSSETGGVSTLASSSSATGLATSADKIIYSADAGIETKEYDRTVEAVYDMIEEYGGFLESSSVGGSSYYGQGGRSASFTIRIPSAQFSQDCPEKLPICQ